MLCRRKNPVQIAVLCLICLTAAAVGQEQQADPTGATRIDVEICNSNGGRYKGLR
jgi:hypothetical protein